MYQSVFSRLSVIRIRRCLVCTFTPTVIHADRCLIYDLYHIVFLRYFSVHFRRCLGHVFATTVVHTRRGVAGLFNLRRVGRCLISLGGTSPVFRVALRGAFFVHRRGTLCSRRGGFAERGGTRLPSESGASLGGFGCAVGCAPAPLWALSSSFLTTYLIIVLCLAVFMCVGTALGLGRGSPTGA